MRVLLTGCAGYLGSVLLGHLLRAGHRVTGVDTLMYGSATALLGYLGDPNFDFEPLHVSQGSTRLLRLAQHHDAVIHLAALVGAPLCEQRPEEAVSVNRQATERLAAGLSAQQRLLFPNTNSGYGKTDGTTFCTEDDPLRPLSLYGRTKCEAEKTVLDHPQGVSLRLATVFGVSPRMRMDLLVNDFTEKLYRDRVLRLFEPHFKRNFVGIQDVARAFLFFLENDLTGVFNVGLPSANLSKLELAHCVARVVHVNPQAVKIGEGTDPDRRNYLVSSDKLLEAGFRFEHDLACGIQEVLGVCKLFTSAETRRMRNL